MSNIIIEAYVAEAINYDNFRVPYRDIQKMREYYNKGSNPKALASTVKTLDKAVSRYYISIATGWNTCAQTFYDRCISLGASKEDLDKIYDKAIKDKSIDIGRTQNGVSNNVSKQEDKPKQTVKATQTPKPIEKPRKVVKAKDDDDFFPFESAINEISRGDLIKLNKAKYDYVTKNAKKLIKDKIDLDITNTLILRWIKGRNWEGGLGGGKDVDRMYERLMSEHNLNFGDVDKRFEKLCQFWEEECELEGIK